jgi:hypothetical protein
LNWLQQVQEALGVKPKKPKIREEVEKMLKGMRMMRVCGR